MFGEAVEVREARVEELRRIESAVKRKSEKQYEAGTILLVEFSDLHFARSDDLGQLRDLAPALSAAWHRGPLILVSDHAVIGVRTPPLELRFAPNGMT